MARNPAARAFVAAMLGANALAAGSAALAAATPAALPRGAVQLWLTTADQRQLLARQSDLPLQAEPRPAGALVINPTLRYQAYVGAGAALTDASAQLLSHSLKPRQRHALLRELFGPAPGGLALGFVRVPIGGSDFSPLHYSLDDQPGGRSDPELAGFRLDPYGFGQVSLLQEARKLNPQLLLMGSPWSAPAWMKRNGSLVGGQLDPRWYGAFADYLVRFSTEFARLGIPLYAMSVQNEPEFEPPDYPGMRFPAPERARFIAQELGPRLAKLPAAPLLLEYDHNWDQPGSPLGVLGDPAAARYVGGVAWHCYKGLVPAQSAVHDVHPQYDAYLTECSGGGWEKGGWNEAMRWFYGNLVIESQRHWSRAVAFWNLALDEKAGPHAGGCKNCRGVVTVDTASGAITRNVEYYALGHLTRCLRPGARRIASDSEPEGIATVAFRNADDGSLVLLAYNRASAARQLRGWSDGRSFGYELPGGAAATFCWQD
jgi:glucosylceramidase